MPVPPDENCPGQGRPGCCAGGGGPGPSAHGVAAPTCPSSGRSASEDRDPFRGPESLRVAPPGEASIVRHVIGAGRGMLTLGHVSIPGVDIKSSFGDVLAPPGRIGYIPPAPFRTPWGLGARTRAPAGPLDSRETIDIAADSPPSVPARMGLVSRHEPSPRQGGVTGGDPAGHAGEDDRGLDRGIPVVSKCHRGRTGESDD